MMKNIPADSSPETAANNPRIAAEIALWEPSPGPFGRRLPNLLTALWLKSVPSAYSFCNLDLHPIRAYSHFDGISAPSVHRISWRVRLATV
jgi:hypothetical protein